MTSANSPARSQPHWRVEDEQLLRGQGRFVDDAPLAGEVYGCFVRSTHAHGKIRNIDVAAARAGDGVLAVLTAADMKAAGVGPTLRHPPMTGRNGAPLIEPPRPALAGDRVMHVGEPVALAVAASLAQAQDAAERVNVDYEELSAVLDARAAMAPGAPVLWPQAPGNLAIDWQSPPSADGANENEVAGIIAAAPHVARISQLNQRIAVATMEPRGGTASYDAATDSLTIRVCSQSAIVFAGWCGELAAELADLAEDGFFAGALEGDVGADAD